jgi:hypothetical protein
MGLCARLHGTWRGEVIWISGHPRIGRALLLGSRPGGVVLCRGALHGQVFGDRDSVPLSPTAYLPGHPER